MSKVYAFGASTSLNSTQQEDFRNNIGAANQFELETPNNNTVKSALNATGNAPIYACRAWVNFDGTGAVPIRASGNVSSITDNGVGDYTVNFITPMEDINFAPIISIGGSSSTIEYSAVLSSLSPFTTTSFRFYVTQANTTGNSDVAVNTISIFR